jgi:uncharacterized protein YeaO (DUF488 family)
LIHQASVLQVRRQEISRISTWIVITMCYYPRGIKKEWRDEFRSDLAPDRELFREWKKYEREVGHTEAFKLSHYEKRFHLSSSALEHLQELSLLSRKMDVYLVCQCAPGEMCHREMLMLLAKTKYGANTAPIFNSYEIFSRRQL